MAAGGRGSAARAAEARLTRPGPAGGTEEGLGVAAARAASWNVLLGPLHAVAALATSVVVARVLSLADYGVYALATAAVASFLLLSDAGLPAVLSRYAPAHRARGGAALGRLVGEAHRARAVLMAVICAAVLFQRGPLASFLPPTPALTVVVLAIGVLSGFARVDEFLLVGLLDRRGIAIARLATVVLQPVLVIAAALAGLGVEGILGALLAGAVGDLVLFRWRAHGHLRGEPTASEALPGWGEMSRFGGMVLADKLVSWMNSPSFVVLLLAGLGRPEEVPLFAVAGELGNRVISLLALPFAGIAVPLFAALEARERSAEQGAAARLYLVLLLLLFVPAAAVLTALATPAIVLVYSAKFAPAGVVLAWLVPFVFLEFAVASTVQAALMVRGTYAGLLLAKLPLLLAAGVLFVAVPRWGAVGAAITYGLGRALAGGVVFWLGRRALGFTLPAAFVGRLAAGAFAAALVGWWLPRQVPGVTGTLLAAALATLAFLAAYRGLGGLSPEDRSALGSAVPPLRPLLPLL